jgi:hypothetical protein
MVDFSQARDGYLIAVARSFPYVMIPVTMGSKGLDSPSPEATQVFDTKKAWKI